MKKNPYKSLTLFTLRLMGDVWTTLAAPPLLLGWLGRRLDAILETRPYVFAACLFLSFVVSTVSLCDKAVKYGERYERLTEQPPPSPSDAAVRDRGGPPFTPTDRS